MIEQRIVNGTGITFSIIIDGLVKRSNYSVKIQAFTRKGGGPFSNLVHTSTDSEGWFSIF